MSKDLTRDKLKRIRASIFREEAKNAGERMLPLLSFWRQIDVWLLYAPIEGEVDTRPLFDALRSRGDTTYFPRTKDHQMEFRSITRWDELEKNGKLFEPPTTSPAWRSEKTVALIPGVGFSKEGHRLGFGKGFYDRFLKTHPEVIRVGIAYDFQLVLDGWTPEPHDEVMDYVLTPSGLWSSAKRCL